MLTSRRSRGAVLRGFTLIELLIVIMIIGVLVGLLIPATMAMRQTARKSQCANNMRQIGAAWLAFAAAKDGRFPNVAHNLHEGADPTQVQRNEVSWIQRLRPYLENLDVIRVCPDDPHAQMRMTIGSEYFGNTNPGILEDQWVGNGTSYVVNEYFADPPPHLTTFTANRIRHVADLKSPARTILAFESNLGPYDAESGDHNHSTRWFNQPYPRNWNFIQEETATGRHRGSANYLFADGHVESIAEEVLHERAKNRDNFALPGKG